MNNAHRWNLPRLLRSKMTAIQNMTLESYHICLNELTPADFVVSTLLWGIQYTKHCWDVIECTWVTLSQSWYLKSCHWQSMWISSKSSPLSTNSSACSFVANSTRYWPAPRSWITVRLACWISLSKDFFRSLSVAVIGVSTLFCYFYLRLRRSLLGQ